MNHPDTADEPVSATAVVAESPCAPYTNAFQNWTIWRDTQRWGTHGSPRGRIGTTLVRLLTDVTLTLDGT